MSDRPTLWSDGLALAVVGLLMLTLILAGATCAAHH